MNIELNNGNIIYYGMGTIEDQIADLKQEKEILIREIEERTIRLQVIDKTIKQTEKHLSKAKEALNANS
jgi:hypothetical protein